MDYACPTPQKVKWPGCGINHPPPSIAEVKEIVKLHLYTIYGLSWPVLWQTQPFPLTFLYLYPTS
jgi:hypothetical protein